MTDEEFEECLQSIRQASRAFIAGTINDLSSTESVWLRLTKANRALEADEILPESMRRKSNGP
jgi:hypothetical protein